MKGGVEKSPCTVECDQPHQDSQVVNRQGHEPDPWLREPFAQQDMILVTR